MPKTFEESVLTKLDHLLRVLTVSVTKGMKQNEQIVLLDRVGLQPKEIADLLGTSAHTVSAALYTLRKSKEGKRRVMPYKKT